MDLPFEIKRSVAPVRNFAPRPSHGPPPSLSASNGDLSRLGSGERNSAKPKARCGPSERARASHWAGVRCRSSDPLAAPRASPAFGPRPSTLALRHSPFPRVCHIERARGMLAESNCILQANVQKKGHECDADADRRGLGGRYQALARGLQLGNPASAITRCVAPPSGRNSSDCRTGHPNQDNHHP